MRNSPKEVLSARSLGASDVWIVFRHIPPQIVTLAMIWATLGLASTVLIKASLSHLGLGIPLLTASWGNMIADGQSQYRSAPWLILVPGTAILMITLGFNLLGDALRMLSIRELRNANAALWHCLNLPELCNALPHFSSLRRRKHLYIRMG